MIAKRVLVPQRVRQINGSFAFIEHRFVQDGFWEALSHQELLLYIFLILVGDRKGLSYYSYDRICTVLKISLDEYLRARNALIEKDLIGFDGRLFQVLSLPDSPVMPSAQPIRDPEQMQRKDPATIRRIVTEALSQ
jgi:hypothetical protein